MQPQGAAAGGASTMKYVKEIETLISMDWQTLVVLAALCGLAAYFIRDYLASPPMIVFVYPVLVFFSYLVQQAFIALETYPTKKLDSWLMWTIMAAIIGNIVAMGVVACLGRLRDYLGSSRPA
jgi:hypothetical protein